MPTGTTTPDVTSLPEPSPLTSQILGTTSTSTLSHTVSSSTIQPQPSPLTVQPDSTAHTPDAEINTRLLESKHIFGIIVGGVLLIVLTILVVVVIGFLAILTARRRNRHQFVETFIETTDNDAYTIRRTALHARSNNGHVAQNLHAALIPHSNDNLIGTKSNIAYLTSGEATMVRSHQANDISVSTFIGPQNGSLKHTLNSHPSNNSIATERNIAYLKNNKPSDVQRHPVNTSATSPVKGTPKGDMNHTIEMKVNEAYHTKMSTLGYRLPEDTEALVMMPQVSLASAKGSGSGMGPVKSYEITHLPCAEQAKNS